MSEMINNQQDLDEILDKIDSIDNPEEVDVPLFQNMKFETPFQNNNPVKTNDEKNYAFSNKVETGNAEYTVIGSSTIIDSNITCGGNIKIKGTVRGTVIVSGSADIYGYVEGDIQANDLTLENGAKVNGNILCKMDINANNGSSITGNISAKNAYINSAVEGNVDANNEVKITSTGSVCGNITTTNISVASGAILNGNVSIKR